MIVTTVGEMRKRLRGQSADTKIVVVSGYNSWEYGHQWGLDYEPQFVNRRQLKAKYQDQIIRDGHDLNKVLVIVAEGGE